MYVIICIRLLVCLFYTEILKTTTTIITNFLNTIGNKKGELYNVNYVAPNGFYFIYISFAPLEC